MEAPLINLVPDTPIREDEDLISFDVQSAILNSSWSIPASEVLKTNPKYNRAPETSALSSNVKRGSGQGSSQAVSRGDTNSGSTSKGPPHTWSQQGGNTTATTVTSNGHGGQGSADRGPPHTWGKATVTAGTVKQGSATPHVLPHLRGKITPAGANGQSSNKAGISNNAGASSWDQPAIVPKPTVSSGPTNTAWSNGRDVRPVTQQNAAPSANNGPPENPWGKKVLSPNAPLAVGPVDLLSSLNIEPAPAKVYKEFDPANPKFKASRFYVDLLGKWKCPHPGCK